MGKSDSHEVRFQDDCPVLIRLEQKSTKITKRINPFLIAQLKDLP
jgi:hypothetical protein